MFLWFILAGPVLFLILAQEAAFRAQAADHEAALRAQATNNEAVYRCRAADVEARAADLQRRLTAAQRENQTRQASQRRLMIREAELKTQLARSRADMVTLQQRLDRTRERLTYIESTAQGATAREWEETTWRMRNRAEQHEEMITQRDATIVNLRAEVGRMQGEIRAADERARAANERVRVVSERNQQLEADESQWKRTERRMRDEYQELTNQRQTLYTETQTLNARIQDLMTQGQQLLDSHQQLQQLSNEQAQKGALFERIVDVLHALADWNDRECAYVAVGFAATLQAAGMDVRMLRINEARLELLKDLIRSAMGRQSGGFHGRPGPFQLNT